MENILKDIKSIAKEKLKEEYTQKIDNEMERLESSLSEIDIAVDMISKHLMFYSDGERIEVVTPELFKKHFEIAATKDPKVKLKIDYSRGYDYEKQNVKIIFGSTYRESGFVYRSAGLLAETIQNYDNIIKKAIDTIEKQKDIIERTLKEYDNNRKKVHAIAMKDNKKIAKLFGVKYDEIYECINWKEKI